MKVKASTRYLFRTHMVSALWFVGIMMACLLFLPLLIELILRLAGADAVTEVRVNGTDFTLLLYAFIVGLCSFKANFGVHLQNGVSRKSFFLGSRAAAAGSLAVASVLYVLLGTFIIWLHTLRNPLYGDSYLLVEEFAGLSQSTVPALLQLMLLLYGCSLALYAFGFMLNNVYYRLNVLGKVAFSVLLFALVAVFPALDAAYLGGVVYGALARLAMRLISHWGLMTLAGLAVAVISSGLSWLLIRRALLKNPVT